MVRDLWSFPSVDPFRIFGRSLTADVNVKQAHRHILQLERL